MIKRNSLPTSYDPYNSLIVCTNKITGGGHIVAIGDVLPLVIGKGEKPKIWLHAISNPEKQEFISVIEASIAKHPSINIIEENETLIVKIQGVVIIEVKQNSEDEAIVSKLDLRPIGLNLFGNEKGLSAGGASFSGNSMSGGGVLIGFGE